MGGKGKNLKTDRKKGVAFRMMFRHHQDPAYYDPKANDKIFIPYESEEMTEEQKAIVDSFPKQDRGIYNQNEKHEIVEEDPVEAVVKKLRIKKKQKKIEKAKKEKNDKAVRFADE